MALSAGGMLSGVLEDEDGWYSAHLTTNQNEAIGRGLSRACVT